MIEREGRGVLLYLAQEGRGIGLLNKLQRLQAAGGGPRHRRREPRARPAGRPARLRHRRADPRRPRADLDPDPHQQPEEDPRPRGLRAVGHRADPDRARAQPAQRGLPARQGASGWATRCTTRACRSTRRCSTPSTSRRERAAERRARDVRDRRRAASTRTSPSGWWRARSAAFAEAGRGRGRRVRRARARSSCRWPRSYAAEIGPLRRRRLPRRGDPRRDRPLRLRLRRGRARHPGRPAAHRRAVRVRRADRRHDGAGARPRRRRQARHRAAHAAEAVLALARLRAQLR